MCSEIFDLSINSVWCDVIWKSTLDQNSRFFCRTCCLFNFYSLGSDKASESFEYSQAGSQLPSTRDAPPV